MTSWVHARRPRRPGRRLAVVLGVAALAAAAVFAGPSSAASSAPVTLPDLRILVPTDLISIGPDPSTGVRDLRFTHITADVGTGPFEIDPTYDSRTGTSTFMEAIYRSPSPGAWVLDHKVPIAATGDWHPPSDYQFPLTAFTLHRANSDGSLGATVATSPKTDYCITGDTMVPGIPNTPDQTFISPGNCGDPTAPLGWSVGWGDEYDQTDAGQPIPLTGVPDGTYILRAVVDPRHVFTESNPTNDVTDTKLTITGDSVTVLSQTIPGTTPPRVSLTSPGAGASIGGSVMLRAIASAKAPAVVRSVQFLLDGHPLGPDLLRAPYQYVWNPSGMSFGRHWLSAEVLDSQGNLGTAAPIRITILHPPPLKVHWVHWRRGILTLALGRLRAHEVVDAQLGFTRPGRTVRIRHEVSRFPTARPRTVTLTVVVAGRRIGGSLVLRLAERPTVWIANPVPKEIVSGIVPVAATASSGTPISFVQFSIAGRRLGPRLSAPPYATRWDTRRFSRGRHSLVVRAVDVAGHSSVRRISVVVENPRPPMTCFVMQAHLTVRGQGTLTTRPFRTALPGETLLALVSADGPAAGGEQTAAVSGGGLRWRLAARANRSYGDSEIWTATARGPIGNLQVTSALGQPAYNQSLTVLAMEGGDGVGARAAASGVSGLASTALRTWSATSLIFAAGNDWSQAGARVLPFGWEFLNQWLDTSTGDTFWSQTTNHPTRVAGSLVNVRATGPAGDEWNLVAVELINSGG